MIVIVIPVLVFLLDAFIKHYIDTKKELGTEEYICGKRLILRKYYNKGAALNFLAKRPKVMRAIHTAILAAVTGAYAMLLRKEGNTGLKISLGMLIGGGLNNLVDRYRKNYVVDYISFSVPWKKFRNIVFNVSDFFVFAGALLSVIFYGRKK